MGRYVAREMPSWPRIGALVRCQLTWLTAADRSNHNCPVKLVLITGPPGTGKSTLAEVAAVHLGAAILAWDWVMAGLTGFDEVQRAFQAMERERYRQVGWSIISNLATAQLRRGESVVLDGVARDDEVAHFRCLVGDLGADALIVSTACSNVTIHRSLVDGRIRGIPGWHELDWKHVESVRSAWTEPADADLRLDASSPLTTNRDLLVQALTSS